MSKRCNTITKERIGENMRDKEEHIIYRVSFWKTGCSYGRCFDTREERDKFAESQREAGFTVKTYET